MRRISLLVAIAAGALYMPASASAAYSVVSNSDTVVEGDQGAEAAECAVGDAPIGGGVDIDADQSDSVYINVMREGGLADVENPAWTAWLENLAPPAGGTVSFTVYAICAQGGVGAYRYAGGNDFVRVPDGAQRTVRTKCPEGEAVVGGGALAHGTEYGDRVAISTSAPFDDGDRNKLPDGWEVTAVNVEDAIGYRPRLFALPTCDKTRGPRAFRYPREVGEVPDGALGGASDSCTFEEELVGGGVRSRATAAHQVFINSTYPEDFSGSWTAFVDNYATSDGATREFVVTAICQT